ncbi:cyclic nucleotide-binding/CBS domain-containing protein [Vitiosangium sp. GDMCC 1.1324]|uniref:CBS domain-containing protein n=1 Tax=Vitiosangium sp. (strain GDMCC 1.1324) TaxID=2138576 RepID=UPI00130EE2EF|nr:CBS domain-containing protein [Vitiosangium sp. GDMCC 1.1324]
MKGHARNLMTAPVKSISPETPLSEIALLLAEERIGGVPVTDAEERVLGMLSEADLMNALLAGRPLSTRADEVMTSPVHTVDEFDLTDEVVALFRKYRIHHLPVVRREKLLGMITPLDVIRFLARDIAEPSHVG